MKRGFTLGPVHGFLLWTLLALVLRCGVAFIGASAIDRAQESGIGGDGVSYYLPLATSLWEGRGFAAGGSPTASHMPIYPLMLAGARLVTPSFHAAVLVVQILCGALAVGLVFLAAASLLDLRAAHLAAFLALVCPDLVLYSVINLSDTPFVCLALAGIVILTRLLTTGAPSTAAWLGLICGLGILVRESMVAFVLPWALSILILPARTPMARRLVNAGLVASVLVAALLPWWVRNLRTFGEFIPLTTKGAHNIFFGTVIRPFYFSDARNALVPTDPTHEQMVSEVTARVEAASSYREQNRIYLQAALESVRRDPVGQFKHLARKFYFLWQPNIAPRHAERVGFAPLLWLIAIAHWLLVLAGVAGLHRLRRDTRAVLVLLVPCVVVSVFHIVVGIGEPRYHLPLLPILIVASSALLTGAARDPSSQGQPRPVDL